MNINKVNIYNMNNKKLSNLYIKYIRKHLSKTNTI